MPHFRVRLSGRNFWLSIDGRLQRLGFYVVRFVEAADDEEAETRALELLAADPKLHGTQNDPSDPPTVDIEEVEEVDPSAIPKTIEGYTFFPDKRAADA